MCEGMIYISNNLYPPVVFRDVGGCDAERWREEVYYFSPTARSPKGGAFIPSFVCTYPCRKGGGNGNDYVRFYCGFYSVDVAVAFLNHFLTVGRHGVNVCRTNITIRQFT
jgi:hypothetical protein